MKRQPCSTLSTTINGSGSRDITVKGFAFLFVGTKLARAIHISNIILNCFWSLFKNVNPLTKRQENESCLIFKRNIAHLTHRQIAFAERLKVFLCMQSLPEHVVFGRYTSLMRIIVLFLYPQSGVNALHILIAFNYFTPACNVIFVLVKMVNFAMVRVDIFCKKKLIAV